MTSRPFKDLFLPRFSRLVKRREFAAAVSRLSRLAGVSLETGLQSRDGLRVDLAEREARVPWKLRGGPQHWTLDPSFILLPGCDAPVFPTLNGVPLNAGATSGSGQGIIALQVSMSQAARQMHHTYYVSGVAQTECQATIQFDLENTVTASSAVPVVVLSDAAGPQGTPATMDPDVPSASDGTYYIPIGHVGAGGVCVNFFSAPLQVTLRAGFLQITQIGDWL